MHMQRCMYAEMHMQTCRDARMPHLKTSQETRLSLCGALDVCGHAKLCEMRVRVERCKPCVCVCSADKCGNGIHTLTDTCTAKKRRDSAAGGEIM
jgi:hypothetical protein